MKASLVHKSTNHAVTFRTMFIGLGVLVVLTGLTVLALEPLPSSLRKVIFLYLCAGLGLGWIVAVVSYRILERRPIDVEDKT